MSQSRDKIIEDIIALFPKTAQHIQERENTVKDIVQQKLNEIIAINPKERTYENTIKAFDKTQALLDQEAAVFWTISQTSPDDALRAAAFEAQIRLNDFSIEYISQNIALYQALKDYDQLSSHLEVLSPERRYALDELLKGYRKSGIDKPSEIRDEIKALKKELAQAAQDFDRAIANDNRTITVETKDLAGLTPEFIADLKKNADGLFVLGVDYPTYHSVMEHCSIESTREALWKQFEQRAYPQNTVTLEKLIHLRSKLAQLLGYSSYAEYDIDNSMAGLPETVHDFLDDIARRAYKKYSKEVGLYKAHIPPNVSLTSDEKIKPWDYGYIVGCYRKNYLHYDSRIVAEYFSLEHTLTQLLKLYEQFLGVSFEKIKNSEFYHPDVQLIKVTTTDGKILGFLLLDLFPRAHKYNHACFMPLRQSIKKEDGSFRPGIGIVIANFTKPSANRPSLLKHSEVTTFFHEFGHAMHALLGATELEMCSGVNVKRDFVEMPSQMLELWMYDRDIIKRISRHYQTAKPLPDESIDTIITLKNFDVGFFLRRQVALAKISLACFSEPTPHDVAALCQTIKSTLTPDILIVPDDHLETAFGHLTGYGAQYYGYLWSDIYAHDLYAYIKKCGLNNPKVGGLYAHVVLGQGGSKDPQEILREFLGRDPSVEPFFEELGY